MRIYKTQKKNIEIICAANEKFTLNAITIGCLNTKKNNADKAPSWIFVC